MLLVHQIIYKHPYLNCQTLINKSVNEFLFNLHITNKHIKHCSNKTISITMKLKPSNPFKTSKSSILITKRNKSIQSIVTRDEWNGIHNQLSMGITFDKYHFRK